MSEPRTVCRHCGHRRVNRPRGLCWTCYYAPGVKAMYPSTSKYARRGIGNGCSNAPAPMFETHAAPGTRAKVEVMAIRARLGQQLHHPRDARTEAR